MSDATDGEAQPATHIWCPVCRAAKPFRNEVIPPVSRMKPPGFDGDHVKCIGCGTVVATLLVKFDFDG